MRKAAILYEDERGPVRDYPLHNLLLNVVSDIQGVQLGHFKDQVRAVPKRGDSKLMCACTEEVPKMPEPHILAIFDADKLHRLLNRPGDTPRQALLEELRGRCPDPRLQVFLLEENTESLILAAATCLGDPTPSRKSKTSRDSIFAKAAWWRLPEVRKCIVDSVPSFGAIAEALASLV